MSDVIFQLNMTENGYSGFGSQFVLEPQNLSSFCNDKSVGNSVPRCRNLKLQLKYFTIRAHPEDTKNYVSDNEIQESASRDYSANDVSLMNDEAVFVIQTNSCESFHSCHSTTSNKDFSTFPQDYGKMKDRHQCNRRKSCEEDFVDQITMINAIFLNKKAFESIGDSSIKDKNIDSFINDKSFTSKTDKSSGDRPSAQSYTNCTCSIQTCVESERTLDNKKDNYQEHPEIGKSELSRSKLYTDNSGLKTFKINRKLIHGTKRPLMSKIIGRKGHQTMLQKIQYLKKREIKCSGIKIQSTENQNVLEEDDELYKGVLLHWKQGINEGYEIHFLEPIQLPNQSMPIGSENTATENLKKDLISCENKDYPNEECQIVNSCDDFEESLLKLFEKLQNSNTSVTLSKKLKDNEINVDFDCKISQVVEEQNCNNENTEFEMTKDHDLQSGIPHREDNFTVLYESETKFSDISLNETFETLFENESRLEKTNDEPETNEIINSKEKTTVKESHESEKRNEQRVKTENISSVGNLNYTQTSCVKRRRSSSRKSSLPVIEESPELTQETSRADVLENDYCLVDTLGRSIHLFDHRGLPLTDSSGRPLRSSAGELLLKSDDKGIPIVDEETHIFDMFGRQPHEEGFQPWMSPQNSRASRLTMGDGRPLVLFDVEGKPLTSISGTMLVDTYGRSLLKLRNCFVQPTLYY